MGVDHEMTLFSDIGIVSAYMHIHYTEAKIGC